MDDLIAFLRARESEREAKAKAANVKQGDPEWFVSPVIASWPRHFTVRSAEDKRPIADVGDLAGDAEADAQGILDGEAVAAHIADNDPKFVLADVTAKRQIIAERGVADPDDWGRGFGDAIDRVLRLLALPYAGHEAYREEWRP